MPFIQQQLAADGITAEGRVVVPKAILEMITNDQVLTMAVNAGGTGYVVGETFDIAGGTAAAVNGVSFVAKGRVTSEAAGVVTGIEIISAGAYTLDPTLTGAATANSSAAGNNDLTVDITMQTARWLQDASTYVDLTTNFEWLCTSVKVSNTPTIGMLSVLSGANDAVRLQVSSGYDGGTTWLNQPGAPPSNQFYLALPNQDPEIFVSITERRVNVLVTDNGRNNKQYGGLGLFIPYVDVATNYPFPGFVHAQSTTVRSFVESYSSTVNAGVVHPINFGVSAIGCYQYRHNLSSEWRGISFDNAGGADVAVSQVWPHQFNLAAWQIRHAPVPVGSTATTADMNPFTSTNPSGSFEDDEFTSWFGVADSAQCSQGPAPLGVGGQLHFTVQAHIVSNQSNDVQILGFIDGWEAVHGIGLAAFEEIAAENGQRYIVFNDTDTTAAHYWVAMEII